MTEKSADGRYIIVDGRRWRAPDPELDDHTRQVLVDELMAARRAVKAALSDTDEAALKAARSRVHDAKVALGERGAPWWEPQSELDIKTRRSATLRSLQRQANRNQPPRSR